MYKIALNKDDLVAKFTIVTHLQELSHSVYSDVYDSYEILNKHEDDIRYSLSLGYLTMAHQSILEFQRVYHQFGLEHYEIDLFIKGYEHYKTQLKEVITDKDSNTSWLQSGFDSFTDNKKSVDEFLNNWIADVKHLI